MNSSPRSMRAGFLHSVETFPNRPALECEGVQVSYAALNELAKSISLALDQHGADSASKFTAVLGRRSTTTYAGMLSALFRGRGYVPLNADFPARQMQYMVEKTECQSLVVDNSSVKRLGELLAGIDTTLTIILPEYAETDALRQQWPDHVFIGPDDLVAADSYDMRDVGPDDIAYIMFTSGSTGTPKAVMISHRNISSFLQFTVDRYSITENDRFSQLFPFNFDISVFDIFVAWERGACVCYPSNGQMLFPGQYATDAKLTVWYASPTMLFHMKRLGLLAPNSYPDVRVSLFVGEALPADMTQLWASAAPNSVVENLYGPTEMTLTCTFYRWDPETSMAEAVNGTVPIGYPHPRMKVLIVDEDLKEVAPGQDGELLMAGDQVSPGYLKDPERTSKAFIIPPGHDEIYYRTGDRVRRPSSDDRPICFLGRKDHQVQVQGARVELGEVENAIREEAGVDRVVVLGWPIENNRAEGLVAFVDTTEVSPSELKKRLAKRLMPVSVPRRIEVLDEFPLNSNGKIDRHALVKRLASSD